MPNTTYGMIPTYGDFVMIKLFAGAFLTPRSIRSSSFIMHHLEAAILDQLGRLGKYLIASSIGPPFSGMLINSSPSTKNAKKLEWPLATCMRCPQQPILFCENGRIRPKGVNKGRIVFGQLIWLKAHKKHGLDHVIPACEKQLYPES
ncbi:hypothetical protein CR513_18870, partial [Mucuna pruriens]